MAAGPPHAARSRRSRYTLKYLVTLCFAIVAVIHLLPLSGVLGAQKMALLCGLNFDDPNLALLMRHGALLFGLLGALLLLAAFMPSLQWLGFIAGFASVLSFLVLAWMSGGHNAEIARVVMADSMVD